VKLDRKTVRLEAAIKSIGLHEVQVVLHPEVQFPLTIDVIPA
jgi:ribosomal protein L9